MTASRSRLSATIDFDKPGKHTGFVRLPYSVHRSAYGWLPIPIASIRNGEGPRVLLMAGNHGDEYEGQVALSKLIRALEPKDISGRIVVLSSANFPAAMAGTRTSPLDQGNLNRSFPGDPDGGPTQQIAYWIEHVLLPQCDYVLDLHSGGSSLMYIPSSLCRKDPDPAKLRRNIELMQTFGAPIGYAIEGGGPGSDQTLSAAALRQGVVSLGTELGGSGAVTPAALRAAEGGIRRVLHKIGALAEKPPGPTPETRLLVVGGSDYYVYAPDGGVFEPLVELGDEVVAGQPAGAIHFHDTPWREPSIAHFERAGLVICKRLPARTERGDCLFHLGTPLE